MHQANPVSCYSSGAGKRSENLEHKAKCVKHQSAGAASTKRSDANTSANWIAFGLTFFHLWNNMIQRIANNALLIAIRKLA